MNNVPQPSVFITGNSSGLGLGCTELYLERGWRVYGCSRSGCSASGGDLRDVSCDLSDLEAIPSVLQQLLGEAPGLDLVILNAGILGEIRPLSSTPRGDIHRIMDINVWANKAVMDWLHAWDRPVRQVVMISSGASVLGSKGMGGYALSKATLNMLARLYAHEFPHTHISAIAPGLIDSAMMDYLCDIPDPKEYPAVQRVREARGSEAMPRPREAAERMVSTLPGILNYASGSYIDIREIVAPDEYARLMQTGSMGTSGYRE